VKREILEGSSLRRGAKKPCLLFVVNVDWFFLSHRLPLARAARDAGFEVVIAAADSGKSGEILREGLGFVPLPFSRRGMAITEELRVLFLLLRLYRRLRPALIHHVTVKPVLYGSLAARAMGDTAVVNAISGLGYTFIADERARVVRAVTKALYKVALRRARTRNIFQNPNDLETFVDMRLVRPDQTALVRGSGVDCSLFCPTPEPEGVPVVVLPSRMLWDKGVREYVGAARRVLEAGERVRFVLVGDSDPDNPTAIPVRQLRAWAREGVVEWWGHRTDIAQVFSNVNLVVLPSYREGLPKVLLEAAASARATVAADVPGCREIVRHGVNGLLVPPRDDAALARAIRVLLRSPGLRERFGRAGREIAVAEFAEEIVVEQTLNLYRELLKDGHGVPEERSSSESTAASAQDFERQPDRAGRDKASSATGRIPRTSKP
jgi:glycosyltransferase involved in cell wall biosynthesis